MSDQSDVESGGDVVAFPGMNPDVPADVPTGEMPPRGGSDSQEVETGGEDAEDFEDFLTGASVLDGFTREDYLQATTEEYRDLAEAVAKAAEEDIEMQAVTSSMPGLEPGLVGFDDVTGEQDLPPEEPSVEPVRSDTLVRFATGLVLIAVILALLAVGGIWFALLVVVVALIALGEFYATMRKAGYTPLALFGFLGGLGVLAAAWYGSGIGGIGTAVGLTGALVVFWYAMVPRRRPLANATITIFGFVWIPVLLAFALPIIRADRSQQLIIALIAVTALFDAGSYFAGRAFGKVALAPSLSPNKTLEGYLGGIIVAFATGAAISAVPWFEMSLAASLWLAGLVAIFAPLGDLAESVVKRSVGVKDMGAVLPGHGGILDRIDSLLFTIPVGYLLFLWLGALT